MLNPNINKRVDVILNTDATKNKAIYVQYKGANLPVYLNDKQVIKAGKRRLYLKYSIMLDRYYLSDRG